MFLYGHPFNFQLMVWTENRKARKWECFQNVVFSLQYIYKSCKKNTKITYTSISGALRKELLLSL